MEKKIVRYKAVPDHFLDTFERYQETKKIYYLDKQKKLQIKDEYYIDEWDDDQKKRIVQILEYYLDLDGVVIAVEEKNMLLGFAALNGKKMGRQMEYLNLGFIHVTKIHRGQGLGKKLFEAICQEARNKGAQKLYIGANPAIDTIKFYQSVGCELATEIIKEIYDHEPLDLQLEYKL